MGTHLSDLINGVIPQARNGFHRYNRGKQEIGVELVSRHQIQSRRREQAP